MLRGFGVGKTSLVSRFVHSMFSDKYLTTVGVKIEKKSLSIDDRQVDLIVWDLHGDDDLQRVKMSYLRGASGYLLVVDATRRSTLDTAFSLHDNARQMLGVVPCILVVNKCDLTPAWEIKDDVLAGLGFRVVRTSAKTGAHVDETFASLARATIGA